MGDERGVNFYAYEFISLGCRVCSTMYHCNHNEVFGGWNSLSFGLSSSLGIGGFFLLHMFSRRTVDEIRLLKSGDFVEIKYFNAFWVKLIK